MTQHAASIAHCRRARAAGHKRAVQRAGGEAASRWGRPAPPPAARHMLGVKSASSIKPAAVQGGPQPAPRASAPVHRLQPKAHQAAKPLDAARRLVALRNGRDASGGLDAARDSEDPARPLQATTSRRCSQPERRPPRGPGPLQPDAQQPPDRHHGGSHCHVHDAGQAPRLQQHVCYIDPPPITTI